MRRFFLFLGIIGLLGFVSCENTANNSSSGGETGGKTVGVEFLCQKVNPLDDDAWEILQNGQTKEFSDYFLFKILCVGSTNDAIIHYKVGDEPEKKAESNTIVAVLESAKVEAWAEAAGCTSQPHKTVSFTRNVDESLPKCASPTYTLSGVAEDGTFTDGATITFGTPANDAKICAIITNGGSSGINIGFRTGIPISLRKTRAGEWKLFAIKEGCTRSDVQTFTLKYRAPSQ